LADVEGRSFNRCVPRVQEMCVLRFYDNCVRIACIIEQLMSSIIA